MRLVLLLSLLVPAWSRAAETRLPVQLSLDFAPVVRPAAAALPPAPLSASIPALAAPALPASAPMPAPVAQALAAGDAHAFYKAVQATGYDLPRGDDHQERLLKEGADREAADRAFFDGQRAAAPKVFVPEPQGVPAPKAKPKRATKLDYDEFGRLIALTPRLSENALRDTEAKRRILIAAGYTHLIGPGGMRIPLSIADEARVGSAFQHTLETYRRRQAR